MRAIFSAILIVAGLAVTGSAAAVASEPIAITPTIGHDTAASAIAFSPDGRFAATGANDNAVKLWDVETGRLIRTFAGHSRAVNAVVFSPDGRLVASGGGDGFVHLHDIASGRETARLGTGEDLINALDFSTDGSRIAAGSRDHVAIVWDVARGRQIAALRNKPMGDQATAVAVLPDGRTVASIGYAGVLTLYDSNRNRVTSSKKLSDKGVFSISFAPDGTRLVTVESDRTVTLWDAVRMRRLSRLPDNGGVATKVTFGADGDTVVATGSGEILVWSAASGQVTARVREEARDFLAAAASPDGGKLLVSSSLNPIMSEGDNGWQSSGRLDLYDARTGAKTASLTGQSSGIRTIGLSADGSRIVSGHYDARLQYWHLGEGRLIKTLEGHSDVVYGVGIGKGRIASAAGRELRFWNAETAAAEAALDLGQFVKLDAVDFSADGRRMIVATDVEGGMDADPDERPKLLIVDTERARVSADLGAAVEGFSMVALSGDGRIAAVSNWDGFAIVDTSSGKATKRIKTPDGMIDEMAFAPDGKTLASGRLAEPLTLWDVKRGRALTSYAGLTDVIQKIAFSPEGSSLAASAYDGSVYLWDARSGGLIRRFSGHDGPVTDLRFSPDGGRLLTGSWDSTIKIWDVRSGALIATLIAFQDGEWVAITPHGFFDASERGAELLNVVRGLEVLPIDRVYQALYRPDLLREALAGDPQGRVRDAAAKLDLAQVLDSGLPPDVLISTPANSSSVEGRTVEIAAEVTDRGGGVGRIEWRVNGVTLGVEARGLARVEAAGTVAPTTLKRTLALVEGENVIELVAYNGKDLVASEPARLALTARLPVDMSPPALYVLAVGINAYWDSRLRLNYAVPDARAIAAGLEKAGAGMFDRVVVSTVYDEDATADKLDRLFASLADQVRPEDVFVFFLAGHGKTIEGRYYFLPYDFRYQGEESIVATGIGQDRWQEWFSRLAATRSVLMYDTCESGSLTGDRVGLRGLERVAALERITRAMGRTVLSAATDDQPALEGYRGHGVFTYSVLDALGRADLNTNSAIEVTELAGYIDAKVPELSEAAFGLRQVPQMKIVGSNFSLGAPVEVLDDGGSAGLDAPSEPTHVVIAATEVFKTADSGTAVAELKPGTQVRMMEAAGAFALVARDGRMIGYVPTGVLLRLQ